VFVCVVLSFWCSECDEGREKGEKWEREEKWERRECEKVEKHEMVKFG